MFILLWFDATRHYESLVKTENVQYEQKIQWVQTFGGTGNDGASSLLQTTDGGFALAGWTNSYGTGDNDMWLVKTDAKGAVQWTQTYGGIGSEWSRDFLQTTDGGFALVGVTSYSNSFDSDILLLKTDVSGIIQWNRTYGGRSADEAYALVQTRDGGFALAGWTTSYGAGTSDMWLVKTDDNGMLQWNQTYGGTDDDGAYTLLQTTDEGFVLAGSTDSYGGDASDIWLVKTDASGVVQWTQTYGGNESDYALDLIQTADKEFVLVGVTFYSNSDIDMVLLKTDENGVVQWNQTYNRPEKDIIYAISKTFDGGFALAGNTNSFGTNDMWLAKTDANGVVQWHQTFGETGSDYAYSLLQTLDEGFVLAGSTTSFGAGGEDIWLVKTSPTSTLEKIIVFFYHPLIAGLIILVVTLFGLIIVIRRQKRG